MSERPVPVVTIDYGDGRTLKRTLTGATIEASGDGLFELDFIADELSPNATWLAMLGYGPDEIETPVRNWRGMIHPDDLVPQARIEGQPAERP